MRPLVHTAQRQTGEQSPRMQYMALGRSASNAVRLAEVVQVNFAPPSRALGQQTTLAAEIILRPVDDPSLLALDLTVSL